MGDSMISGKERKNEGKKENKRKLKETKQNKKQKHKSVPYWSDIP